jgi:hypothetical protein
MAEYFTVLGHVGFFLGRPDSENHDGCQTGMLPGNVKAFTY